MTNDNNNNINNNNNNNNNHQPTNFTPWDRSNSRVSTQFDAGFRRNSNGIGGSLSLPEFKEAISKIHELRSSQGYVYTVKGVICDNCGESVILLCSDPNGKDVAAKIYNKDRGYNYALNETEAAVVDYMHTEDGKKYSLSVIEVGILDLGASTHRFDIMPYYPDADMSLVTRCSFDKLVEFIRQANEALHSIHKAGIIHRDIKLENLYQHDGHYMIGDFGIARLSSSDNISSTMHLEFTPGYNAPETYQNVYCYKSDYYSLGIVIASLFEGHFIFRDYKDNDQMIRLAQYGGLPITKNNSHKAELMNLLNGLCRIDPFSRFGYEEVKKWLADHRYNGNQMAASWPVFTMLGETYTDAKSMFAGFTKDEQHWEEAKEMLYNKYIEKVFASTRPDIANSARKTGEKYRRTDPDKGLAIFLKMLYAPGPIAWKGAVFMSLKELADKMVKTRTPLAYAEFLQNNVISYWLENTEGIDVSDENKKIVDEIENLSINEPELACYWFGYSFAGNKELNICNTTVKDVAELIDAMFKSANRFYQGDAYDKLMDRKQGAELYGFLYSFGFKKLIETRCANMSNMSPLDKTSVIFSVLENIAIASGVDPSKIRSFFVTYGPVGAVAYTKALVENGVYYPLTDNGTKTITNIKDFRGPATGTIGELLNGYSKLFTSVDDLQKHVVDNPHCVISGIYDDQQWAACTNLKGCFAFKIFGRYTPLGFCAFLEAN